MYADLLYVAGPNDEADFRDLLRRLQLQILPERPGAPSGLSREEIERNPCRLLSLKPLAQVRHDPRPFPHYSPAVAALLDWGVPLTREGHLIAGRIRHHRYMEKKGLEYQEIGTAFSEIRNWMKSSWTPLNQCDFIGPEASRLVAEGYKYSSFDPAKTTYMKIDQNEK